MAKMTPPPLLVLILGLAITTQYCSADDVLLSPEALYSGHSLNYGPYIFTMQNDCNLVLYDSGNPVWASNTGGRGYNCRCVMQRDGNLVVYDQNNNAVWASGTSGADGNYVLVLQKDRNVVIYGPARWSTGTNYRGSRGVVVGAAQNSTAAVAAAQNSTAAVAAAQNSTAAAAAAGEVIADVGVSDAR